MHRNVVAENGIPLSTPLYPLQATSTVPIVCISEDRRRHWPHDLLVMPNYAFAVDCSAIDLKLSAEHTEFEWVQYERAYELLRWESNKVALWELHERLSQGGMPKPE